MSQEEVYFVNTSKTATVSKSISKPNEEFLDDTTLSVARKFLNEVKSTIVTLQRVVKHRMTLDTHNWSSSAHQEIHKILKEEIFPIINQVDSRLQNFEIQFLKEAAKFVRDFKSLAKEADESLAKHKTLELEIERLLRAVVSQDIMSIVQNPSVVDSSNLQTELDRTKERLENCIIKKENEYAKLWNDWYKKCEECKYDKISYDKAYNDMQQKIERLQAQLGDQKGKSQDTPCVSNTLDPLSQKLENENVELEFQVRNYEKEIAHLKTTYKNLFDSISVTRAQTKTIIDSLQHKLHDTIYENAKLRAQLFDKVSDQVDTTKGTSTNTKFANQKVDETNDLSKPVTSNSVPTPQESKSVKQVNVIAPGMFRINPFKPSREEKYVPNKVRASVRTTPITVSQPHVVTKKDVNSDSNGLSSTGVDNTAKTRRPQPRSNTKNDRVPSASKSSCNKNKEVEVEEHHRNLLLSKNKKHMSSECKHVKLDIRNDKSEVICAMCKQCLITANHDVCMLNYVNDMNSRGKKQKAIVSNTENQKKQKSKNFAVRSSPTGILFDIKGKINASSESEKSNLDCSQGDNACTSNPSEPTIKRFPNSTSFLGRSKDEAPEVIKTFLKRITVLLQSPYSFGALCYPKNDREDIGKLGAKGDIGFFIGYSADSCAYRVYNRRTKKIMETMNVTFDELSVMAFEQSNSKPGLQSMTPRQNLSSDRTTTSYSHDEENTIIQNKTRLVVRGYRQEEGIDFEEKIPLLLLLEWKLSMIYFCISTPKSFIVFQMDVKTAFLHDMLTCGDVKTEAFKSTSVVSLILRRKVGYAGLKETRLYNRSMNPAKPEGSTQETTPLDRVEVLVEDGNPLKPTVKQALGRLTCEFYIEIKLVVQLERNDGAIRI
ncbi:retrovirus-related pol polyprotein from transposon TNT 1-94 [Tanacetum coccineum]